MPPSARYFAGSCLLLSLGCTPTQDDACPDRADPFVDCVVALRPHPETDYNHDRAQSVVTGPPRGALDTVSLGCGGEIELEFSGLGIDNGPGPDLIVFENPFDASFPEPGEVSVSADGERWHTFPCDSDTLSGCAGVGVTLATQANGVDPTSPDLAGGDAFDLSDLAEAPDHISFVRITDVSEAWWKPQGQDWCDPGQDGKGGFDLDAVAAVHGEAWP